MMMSATRTGVSEERGEPKITRENGGSTGIVDAIQGERKREGGRGRSVLQTHPSVTFDWLAGR